MSAIDWIRSKAKVVDVETIKIEEGTYKITLKIFKGNLPTPMFMQLKNKLPTLLNTEQEREVLRIGGPYRSDFGKCTYSHTTYEKID